MRDLILIRHLGTSFRPGGFSHIVRVGVFAILVHPAIVNPEQAAGQQVALEPSAVVPAEREGAARRLHDEFMKRAEQQQPVDLLFLGDSITQGWNDNPIWQRFYGPRHAANFGIGGDRTQHVLWRLEHGELYKIRPRVVVLMIGTNNIGRNPTEEVARGVEAVVSSIHDRLPETKILLLGIFPRGKTRSEKLERDERDPRVDEVNQRISRLGERPWVKYLDISDHFLDEEGKVSRDLMPDFLHLSRRGYQVWAEAMEPTLWELLQGP